MSGGQAVGPESLSATQPVLLGYFVRSMLDGSPSSQEMFSESQFASVRFTGS